MTSVIDFVSKMIETAELDREDFKKILEEKLVKERVFITANEGPIFFELMGEHYHMSPKIVDSDVMILTRIYSDGIHMFALGKKNKSLQESLCDFNDENVEHMSDDIYEKLAFVMVDEKIPRPGKRNKYISRYVAIKDEEGKIIMIDKILDMLFVDK